VLLAVTIVRDRRRRRAPGLGAHGAAPRPAPGRFK